LSEICAKGLNLIGIDLVKVERISRIRAKFGDAFLRKFLTQNEINLIKNDRSLAGFYAAKEAIAKALGTGIGVDFSFLDAQIYKDEKGAPRATLAPKIVDKFGIQEISLSITHDGDYAVAAVMILANFRQKNINLNDGNISS
jgi:holo-[acyl-carrier-protein] synthase